MCLKLIPSYHMLVVEELHVLVEGRIGYVLGTARIREVGLLLKLSMYTKQDSFTTLTFTHTYVKSHGRKHALSRAMSVI